MKEVKLKSKLKNQKAITLIALVITIIVLLILAAVSIATLTGNNGLLTKANEVKSAKDAGAEKEQIELSYNAARIKALTKEDGIVTATNLNDELIANGVTGASVTGSGTLEVTMPSGNVYTIDSNGKIAEFEPIDWDAIIADATANPDNYKHAGQSATNGDIGIGTDGKPVNLDLWTYEVINENEIVLGSSDACIKTPGYQNSNIVGGKIIGAVPQYIKVNGSTDFYAVTSMFYAFVGCTNLTTAPTIPSSVTDMSNSFAECTNLTTAPTIPSSVTVMVCTFYGCRSLTIAPTIPSSVTNMEFTFEYCTSLKKAPTIPSSVTDMYSTFRYCTNLQGTIEINANPKLYTNCFYGAATEGTGLVVTGASTMLDTLIATKKSDDSNIIKGTN